MIRGYRLQPSVPSWRSSKRRRKRKTGQCGHPPGLPGTARTLPAPNFVSLAPQCVWPSSLRAQARDAQAGGGWASRGQSAPGAALGGCDAGWGARAGRGLAAPPPGGPGASNGGAAAPSARARRSLPAKPAALGPAPPRAPGADPGGRARTPNAALHWRAPSAGVRPSRGYITGLGPSGAAGGLGVQAVGGGDAAAHLP